MAGYQLEIRLLGGFVVFLGGRPVSDGAWRLRKAKGVVKLLALTPEHRLHRDRVAELLWPDRDSASAANNLHQALHAARRALKTAAADADRWLQLRDEALSLGDGDKPLIDLEAFEAAAERARTTGTADAYREALALYRGELLPEDRYEDWTAGARETVRELRLGLLVELAEVHGASGEGGTAIDVLQKVVAEDPLHEGAQRRLMELFAEGGRRQQALGQFQQLRQTLRRELEADPEPQTRELYQDILAGRFLPAQGARAAAPDRGPAARRQGAAVKRRLHNLPLQLTSFIGRRRELEDVRGALGRTRLLTLTGPGGCGKTRLALEIAEGAVGDFEDGVWVIELASVFDPALVVQETAAVLELLVRSSEHAADVLAGQIGDRELMLVVDNCEHLIDACAELAGSLLRACPNLRILATSREPLRVSGEVTWRVPSLALPAAALAPDPDVLDAYAAVRLFGERASDVVAGFSLDDENAAAVAEICRRLDGMPLAIELAAARIALLSPIQIAERLRESLAVLGDSRTGPTRQQTLTATLQWSHDLLDADERALFRRLAVFAGSFRLDAAETVCTGADIDSGRILQLLGQLVDKSLVGTEEEAGENRYRMLETIRQYARERLREAREEELVEAAQRQWCLTFAEEAEREAQADAGPVYVRLELEHDNLRAALASALEHDPPAALRLAVALWEFWRAQGDFAEGSRWLDDALARNPERSALRARALFAAEAFDVRRGRVDRIVDLGEECVAIYRELGDRSAAAEALHIAGFIQHSGFMRWNRTSPPGSRLEGADGYRSAQRAYEESMAIAAEEDDPTIAAAVHHAQGIEAHCRGDDEAAIRKMRESVELAESVTGENGAGVWVVTIGLPLDRDRHGRLRLYFEETVLLFQHVPAAVAAGYFLCSLSLVARTRQDHELAGTALDDALSRFNASGDRFGAAVALTLMGGLARSTEQFELGRDWLDEALEIRRSLGDRREIALTLCNRALLEGRAGEPERGRELIERSFRIMRETEDVPGAAGVTLNLANLELEAGNHARAMSLLSESAELFRANWYLRPVAWPLLVLAETLIEAGVNGDSATRARDALADARRLFTEARDARGIGCLERAEAQLEAAAPGVGVR